MALAPQHLAAVEAAPPLTDEQLATVCAVMRSVDLDAETPKAEQ